VVSWRVKNSYYNFNQALAYFISINSLTAEPSTDNLVTDN